MWGTRSSKFYDQIKKEVSTPEISCSATFHAIIQWNKINNKTKNMISFSGVNQSKFILAIIIHLKYYRHYAHKHTKLCTEMHVINCKNATNIKKIKWASVLIAQNCHYRTRLSSNLTAGPKTHLDQSMDLAFNRKRKTFTLQRKLSLKSVFYISHNLNGLHVRGKNEKPI